MPVSERPNILFLMSDQHRADFTGYEGHVVRTPTLDWLARTGAQFRNAYAPNPVCVPCRQAMMAGQFPRTCGVTSFHGDLPPGHLTFARHFSRYAYETVCCGKLHHGGPDQMQGWRWRIGEETHIAPHHIDGRVEDEFAKYKKAGDYGPLKSVTSAGTGFNPVELVDAYTTQGALNFIRLYYQNPLLGSPVKQPVLLKHSLIAPHDPFITQDTEAFAYYHDRVSLFPREAHLPEMGGWPPPFSESEAPPEARRRALAAYCAMIEGCDRQYGRVLDALRAAGHDLDDWVIIYVSDHGEMMGEKDLWWKFRFYEGSVRVPMLIRAPRFFEGGRVIRENVSLCDLFATLCEFAGLPVPSGLDSRRLLPLLRGEGAGWDDEAISQLNTDQLMIKRGDLKYIFYGASGTEILFDLARDPRESINAVADPRHAASLRSFRLRRAALGYGGEKLRRENGS